MKQVAQNYKTGQISLVDVPVPSCKPGGVLVRTHYSLVSMGTESMKIRESKLSLVGKARARPDQVKKVLSSMAQQGPVATYKKVMNRLDSLTPLGYSLSGEVVDVGPGVAGLRVGQRVACAGNKYALHAEYNWVPVNLCTIVPDSVTSKDAAYTTVASIAMQAFRQSQAVLGETACVIGLGLLGQILTQILKAAGVSPVGVDLSPERCALARELGALACGVPEDPSFAEMLGLLDGLTEGAGVDHVFLAASGDSNGPVEMAAELARDRGRVIDVGKCRLDLPWKEYYEKELDVRFSRSYGPGRYDPTYEEGGVDYPIGYVRWTENRNMQSVLRLIESGDLNVGPITNAVIPFEEAAQAYEDIHAGRLGGLGIVFSFGEQPNPANRLEVRSSKTSPATSTREGRVVMGVIGCGNYATTMLLPHLKSRPDVALAEVVTATSLSAANAQARFGFDRVSTEHEEMLADPTIDAVLIATRHDSHARLVCAALRAGKAVFVEKPLALSPGELSAVLQAVEESGNDRLMVGFNRRFASLLVRLRDEFGTAPGPQMVTYTVNAGPLDAESWYRHVASQGSRFVGEGGHFVDTISWWLGQDPMEVYATRTSDDPDNLLATLSYPGGSIATVCYTTTGDPRYPKETFQAFSGGSVARLDNFKSAEVWRGGKRTRRRALSVDKGQKPEVEAFVEAVARGHRMPTPISSLVATTAATILIERSSQSGNPERIADWAPTDGSGVV